MAHTCYASLKMKSISSLPQLFVVFESNFASTMVPKQPLSHLWTIHKKDYESLRSYVMKKLKRLMSYSIEWLSKYSYRV